MKIIAIILVTSVSLLMSCKNDVDEMNCDSSNPICSQTPPTDEACAAYFERWFYDKTKNSCSKISYSGCSQNGFSTKEECEACKCK